MQGSPNSWQCQGKRLLCGLPFQATPVPLELECELLVGGASASPGVVCGTSALVSARWCIHLPYCLFESTTDFTDHGLDGGAPSAVSDAFVERADELITLGDHRCSSIEPFGQTPHAKAAAFAPQTGNVRMNVLFAVGARTESDTWCSGLLTQLTHQVLLPDGTGIVILA